MKPSSQPSSEPPSDHTSSQSYQQHRMIELARKTYHEECQVPEHAKILVACSGGADSVALLHFLHNQQSRLSISKLGVYHLHHGLRGKEADEDEKFVQNLAGKLNLSFHSRRADVAAYATQNSLSIEMAGRRLRYAGLEATLNTEKYSCAALGHTATDNVEWIFLSLIRGRAEPMLWGIPARRDRYIRPLIRCSREEILDYLESNQIPYRQDTSNLSLSFDRNRIRHRLLPILKEFNPSLESTLSRMLAVGDQVKDSLDVQARELLTRFSTTRGKHRELDTSALSHYNLASQIRVLRRFVPWLRVHDLARLVPLSPGRGTSEIARWGSQRLTLAYDRLIVSPVAEPEAPSPYELNDEVYLAELGWRISVTYGNTQGITRGPDRVYFDEKYVKPPLVVRPWKEGDRIVPFGHTSEVKIKRIFTDRKVPRQMRFSWPLVCKGDEVIWVVGILRSAAAPVKAETERVTILTLMRGENDE